MAKRAQIQEVLNVRAYVVYQWLAILQETNPYYKKDPKFGSIAEFEIFKNAIESCKKMIHDGAIHVHDGKAILEEKIMGDNVARVRTGIFQKADQEGEWK